VRAQGLLVALAGAGVGVGALLGACSIDFDQFNPTGTNADASASDATTVHEGGPQPDNQAANVDAGGGEAASDTAAPDDVRGAADATNEGAICTPPPSCLSRAQTCGATCARQLQQCLNTCGNPCSRCTTQEQACAGQCASTCIGCTQDAGCPASGDCLDAARSGQ
jgi:hypothetical protein